MKLHDVKLWLAPPPPAVAHLHALADRVATAVAPAERLAGPDTWFGPAADDARAAVGAATRQAGEAAVALRLLARRIEDGWRAELALAERAG
jgi:hypothetical protein